MKKELSVSVATGTKTQNFVQVCGEGLAAVYSSLLEEKVSVAQAWKILHASAAFSFAVFAQGALLLHFMLVGWFLFTLWDCKRAGLK